MTLIRTVLASCLLLVFPALSFAQSCLTSEDIASILTRVDSTPAAAPNRKLKTELLKISASDQLILTDLARSEGKTSEEIKKRLRERSEKISIRFCSILKQFGWPTKELVDPEGVAAGFRILKDNGSFELQKDLLPVIVAALKKDESQKPEFAGLVDRLRVGAGMKQLFGTQAVASNGFLVVYPIEDEAHLDDRRRQYGLDPFAEHLRRLERQYLAPVIRSRDTPNSQLPRALQTSVSDALKSTLPDTPPISEDDIIRVNTNLVNVDVSVFNKKMNSYVGTLTQNDFKILEDGHEATISFFGSIEVPFDLVLLVDLSTSTEQKRELIRTTTQKFINAARPLDRIAIVTFSDTPKVVSPLTIDRPKLLAAAGEISGGGGSSIWDALKFTLDQVLGQRTLDRRSAVVMMTDGYDSAMSSYGGSDFGSRTSFADLLEIVRHSDALIVPIYLDTESDEYSNDWKKKVYSNARKMLATLASESGGSYYKARHISDLNGVYEQVINDLGKIYSLGYKPINEKRDGSWRNVQVQVINRPDLIPHAKPGYYAQ